VSLAASILTALGISFWSCEASKSTLGNFFNASFCFLLYAMIKIQLIWIGKTKASFIKKGIEYYERRLRPFVSFEIKEIKDVAKGLSTRHVTVEKIKKKEAHALAKAVQKSQYVVCLEERGARFDSKGFSRWLSSLEDRGISTLAFVVGGPFGLHEEFVSQSHYSLSLSPMTFTHEMTRLILMEQLYRAYTIVRNVPYHY